MVFVWCRTNRTYINAEPTVTKECSQPSISLLTSTCWPTLVQIKHRTCNAALHTVVLIDCGRRINLVNYQLVSTNPLPLHNHTIFMCEEDNIKLLRQLHVCRTPRTRVCVWAHTRRRIYSNSLTPRLGLNFSSGVRTLYFVTINQQRAWNNGPISQGERRQLIPAAEGDCDSE